MNADVPVPTQPDFVRTLPSGVEPTDDPLTLHPIVADDLDEQLDEMREARDRAAVSGQDYWIGGPR